jgi:hypothetical protein
MHCLVRLIEAFGPHGAELEQGEDCAVALSVQQAPQPALRASGRGVSVPSQENVARNSGRGSVLAVDVASGGRALASLQMHSPPGHRSSPAAPEKLHSGLRFLLLISARNSVCDGLLKLLKVRCRFVGGPHLEACVAQLSVEHFEVLRRPVVPQFSEKADRLF